MKRIFSISEISKIVDIPIDTLKHYDRIDLFKPAIVNPDSKYRYYTLEQIYTLVLIKDLRRLDMSIPEIKNYISEMNFVNSLKILEERLYGMSSQIRELTEKRNYLQKKINMLKANHNIRYELKEIVRKNLQKRTAISYGVCIKSDDDKYFASRQLEKTVTTSMPGIIFCTHGVFIPKKELVEGRLLESAIAFALIDPVEASQFSDITTVIPSGQFICGYYEGKMWSRKECLQRLLDEIKKNDLTIAGDGIQINYIDDNFTSCENEFLYEIQIPVSNNT